MESTLATVFKAYDIRGLAPEQIDAKFARRLGATLIATHAPKRVMVGRDMRTTSSVLETALIDGLTSGGAEVVRIGLCSTPMFNVLIGLGNGSFDLGVMITASHNPGKYNGFKISLGDCTPVGEGSGMEQIRDAFLADAPAASTKKGSVTDDPTALDRYLDHIVLLAKLPSEMPKMKIAIDAGNGMAGSVLPRLLQRLPWIEAVSLYFDPDGSFPNHEANPIKLETLADVIRVVNDDACALGVAFDGDADRVGFIDETGTPIPGDLLTALFAQEMLRDTPGGLIAYDVRSSWTVPEAVAEAGGRSEMCKVGHANIKKLMKERGGLFSGELSMHFYFSQLWNCESGDLGMLLLLRRMAREKQTLSALWSGLKRYAHSPEINFDVKDKNALIRKIEDAYAKRASSVSHIDGIRVEFRDATHPESDWWFSIRASNTEPLLRLNVEARTAAEMDKHVQELTTMIRNG